MKHTSKVALVVCGMLYKLTTQWREYSGAVKFFLGLYVGSVCLALLFALMCILPLWVMSLLFT